MSKQTKKYLLYISLLVVFSAIAVFFVLKDDAEAIITTIKNADIKYLLIGFLLVIVSYCLNGLFLAALTRIYNKRYRFFEGVANHLIGTFFSAITPSSTGGQFVQAYTFTKQGVTVTNGASILFMAFIIRQIIAIIFSFFTFTLKFKEMMQFTATFNILGFDFNLIMLSAIGFIVNMFVLMGLFFMAFSKKLHYIVVHGIINFLKKIKVLKGEKAEEKKKEIDSKVATFRVELKRLLTNWKVLIFALFIIFLDSIIYNVYPYLMSLAVGADLAGKTVIDGICMANFVGLITMMIPIPGAAGGAEAVFSFMFSGFLDGDIKYVNSIILLWRFFTFYINVIVGVIVFMTYRASPKKQAIEMDYNMIKDIEILSLTQEITFNINNTNKIEISTDGKKKRKKYRPRIIDEQVDEVEDSINIEKRFDTLKKELEGVLKENEKRISEEVENKENNL